MKNANDSYDFTYPSRSGKFGFETFRSENDGLYYFHFNNSEGQPFLFSQGYQNKKSLSRAIRSVIKNAAREEHFTQGEEPDRGLYFLLRAGNNQEIARSSVFKSKREMLDKMALLRKLESEAPVWDTPEPIRNTLQVEAGARVPPDIGNKAAMMAARYRFTLTYYPKRNAWAVKNDLVEHQEPLALQKLDGEKIVNFIEAQMANIGLDQQDTGRIKGQGSAGNGLKDIEADKAPGNFVLKTKGDFSVSRVVREGELSGVELKLLLPGKKAPGRLLHFDAQVFAKSLQSHKEFLIGEMMDELPEDGRVEIPILGSRLPHGIYRITASVTFNEADSPLEDILDSRVIMVN
ncbi:MAG: DUF1508 domain-containing protein [Phaeodactylibacter sp.]|nr:DUF1508 domain-containing protein [Phaeodactylibacter sp.]